MGVDEAQQQFQQIGAPVDVADDIGREFRLGAIYIPRLLRQVG